MNSEDSIDTELPSRVRVEVRGIEGEVLHQEELSEGLRVTLLTDDGLKTVEISSAEVEEILNQVEQETEGSGAETRDPLETSHEASDPSKEEERDTVEEAGPDAAPNSEESQEVDQDIDDPEPVPKTEPLEQKPVAEEEGRSEDRAEKAEAGEAQPGPEETPPKDPAEESPQDPKDAVSEPVPEPDQGKDPDGRSDPVAREAPEPSQAQPQSEHDSTPGSTEYSQPGVTTGASSGPARPDTEETAEGVKEQVLSPELEPRDYQQSAIEKWLDNDCVGILNMATGTGKTLTSLFAIDRLWPKTRMVVVSCPTLVLVEQWADAIRDAFPESAIFEVTKDGPWRDAGPLPEGPTFLVGTYHSLSKEWFREWGRHNLEPSRTALIVDEVHRSGAPTFSRVYRLPADYRMGLSATPTRSWDRGGNTRIRDSLDKEVFYYGLDEAIDQGHLVPYTYHVHILPLTEEEREAYGKISEKLNKLLMGLGFDPEEGELPTFLSEQRSEDEEIVEKIEKLLYARSDILKEAQGKTRHLQQVFARHDLERCLVYCNTKDQVSHYVKVLQSEGKTPAVYTSDQDRGERRQALRAYENGDVDFIVAIRCLDEGVDIPEAREAILISSSSSVREFIQRRGRLLRPSEDKSEATIHDLVVLPVDPEVQTSSLESYERAAIQKEFLRAHIFNRIALNREANKPKIDACLEEFGIEIPYDWVFDATLREALRRADEMDEVGGG